MGEGDLAAMDTVLAGKLQAHSRVWVYRANPTLYVTESRKMVPNHTFLFQNIYYCNMNTITFLNYFIKLHRILCSHY